MLAEDEEQLYDGNSFDHEETAAADQDTNRKKIKETIARFIDKIHYSPRYNDLVHEYRHVILPKDYYSNYIPDSFKNRLLSEQEWRAIGIQQSPGWYYDCVFKGFTNTACYTE